MSKLRAKSPEELDKVKRLKVLISGPSGSGKSTIVGSFPRTYIIDSEQGMSFYKPLLEASGSKVFQTTDPQAVVEEVRTLLAEEHDFLTIAIDPCTNIWHEEIEQAEARVGEAYGKHYGAAGKATRRLVRLLLRLDMNIIFTAHQKEVYSTGGAVIDTSFDGWKKSDYFFDLWLKTRSELSGDKVTFLAKVAKTRLDGFPPLSEFVLGESTKMGEKRIMAYQAIAERFGGEKLEAARATITLATAEQVSEAQELLEKINPSEEWLEKVYKYAGAEDLRDFSTEHIVRFIQKLKEMRGI